MDPRNNPYAPGAGSKPPALVGRDDQLTAFEILLERLERGRAEQSLMFTGLRGVGKTVLLDACHERAQERAWATVEWEVKRDVDFAVTMAGAVRRCLLQIAPKTRWSERLQRAASVLKAFTVTFSSDGALTAGLDVEAAVGAADTGDLHEDLSDLFLELGEAARQHRSGVVFLLDEIQFLPRPDLEALIVALHRCARRSLPIALVGAGLPQVPRLAGEAKSYSERLFRFTALGPLSVRDASEALARPAAELGVAYEPAAVAEVVDYTQGYPYFLQEYGRIVWDEAGASPVTRCDVLDILPLVESRLDESFFHVRAERLTDLELRYLFAMAEVGARPQRAAEVARRLGRTSQQAAPLRSRLIEKGLLYTPEYGFAAFTVPQFDRYMLRRHADLAG